MSKKKWHREDIELYHSAEANPVPIVHDAALANRDICGGQLVPILYLDMSNRPDLKACLESHVESGRTGDVETVWGRRDSATSGPIMLMIKFKKPALCTVILHLDPDRQGGIIDQIVFSEAVWLTWGSPGDRFLNTMDRVKVLVGVESKEFRPVWDSILDRTLRNQARKAKATAKEAELYSQQVRQSWRSIGKALGP